LIFLDTKTNADNLQIANSRNVTSLYVSGCPNVNTQAIIENIMKDGGELLSVRIMDADWAVNINDNTAMFEVEVDPETGERTETKILSDQGHAIITDLKILDYMYNIDSGLDDDPTKLAERKSSNNLYFSGRVLIKNTGYAVDDYAIKQKYSRFFPNLEIVYEDETDIITGYEIIIHTGASADGKDIATATDLYQNSIVLSSEDVEAGFGFRSYLESNVARPSRNSTVDTNYIYQGWVYEPYAKMWDNTEIGKAIITNDTNILTKAFSQVENQSDEFVRYGIKSTNGALDQWCPDVIYANAFTHRQLHLYPVFKTEIRKYTVTYMFTPESNNEAITGGAEEGAYIYMGIHNNTPVYVSRDSNGTLGYYTTNENGEFITSPVSLNLETPIKWTTEEIPYGQPITLPTIEPAIIKMTADKAQTTIRRVTTYVINGRNYSDFSVTGAITLYPVYGSEEAMSTLVEPRMGYFDEEEIPLGFELYDTDKYEFAGTEYSFDTGVIAIIKSDYKLPAITIPRMLNGKVVVSVKN